MSDTAIGLLLIGGWSVAIPALVRLWACERKLKIQTEGLLFAKERLSEALDDLAVIRANSDAARSFGLGSRPECAAWAAATRLGGPSVIPVFRVGDSEEGGSK